MHSISYSRLTMITAIGGCLEFFDFTIFALFTHYISRAFFPFADHLISIINTFAIFAVGYFARPLGGIIISHIGDRVGRKAGLLIAVNLMACTTLCIALLPTYQQIGITAPLLLIVLRLLQGAAVGGEIPGVVTYLTEFFHSKNPIFAIAVIIGGITFGNVFASGLGYLLTRILSEQEMASWGWRIPFLVGALLGFIGYLVRYHTKETIIFIRLVATHATHRYPAYKAMKYYFFPILLAAGMTAMTSATVFLFLYLPVFLHTVLQHTVQNSYLISMTGFIILGLTTMLWGFLAQLSNPYLLVKLGCIFVILLSILAIFYAFTFKHGILYFTVLLALLAAMTNSSYTYIISQLFPSEVRYSGIAIAYNVGVACFGAIAPVSLMSIYKYFHIVQAPFWFLLMTSCVSLICFSISKKSILGERTH